MMSQTALKYDVEVKENGRVELDVPFPVGAHLTVFIIESDNVFNDLLMASESSTDFWNNPVDEIKYETQKNQNNFNDTRNP